MDRELEGIRLGFENTETVYLPIAVIDKLSITNLHEVKGAMLPDSYTCKKMRIDINNNVLTDFGGESYSGVRALLESNIFGDYKSLIERISELDIVDIDFESGGLDKFNLVFPPECINEFRWDETDYANKGMEITEKDGIYTLTFDINKVKLEG